MLEIQPVLSVQQEAFAQINQQRQLAQMDFV